jgi:apolipoprotein N-acyltransferase
MGMIAAAAQRATALTGWGRLAVAFAAGALSVAALPPFHVIPALWIAVPLLLWILEGCPTWRATAIAGWAFGFGHFLFGLSWITHAFFVDAETFGLLAWPALLGLTWGMGLFFACVSVVVRLVPIVETNAAHRGVQTAARALLLASAWMVQEWVRNWILTGFPWNPIATVWAEDVTPLGLSILQATSIVGTFGLSLITLIAAALPAVLAVRGARRLWLWPAGAFVLLAGVGIAGAVRLSAAPMTDTGVKFRLVQPNVPQAEKWRPELREVHLRDYVYLSTVDRPADVNVVVWGEAAISFLLDRDAVARQIAAAAAPLDGLLITGGDRAESRDRVFNSLYVLTPDANIVATYDKFHLVPFGEFMPLADILPFRQLTGMIGFSAGPGLRTLSLPGLPPVSPLICFEVIFSGNVTAPGTPEPRWLLNLTNDSWFGTATGPYQHLATARLRAIEEGLPLVRTANTGISAVVDAHGRIRASLGLNRRGVVDAALPETPVTRPFFAVTGNLLPLLCATIAGCAALVLYRRTKS